MLRRLIALAAVLGGLYWISLYNWLLFHALVELTAVLIGVTIFMIVWNSRRFATVDSFIVILGIGHLFVAAVDVLHTLAYRGMGLLMPPAEVNVPTQFWVAGRYLQGLSLLAPLVVPQVLGGDGEQAPDEDGVKGASLRQGPPPRWVWLAIGVYAAVTTGAVVSILWWPVFPRCYVEGQGLTAFKVVSEYIIAAMFAAVGALLWRRRRQFEPNVWQMLLAFTGLTILSELMFTLYVDPYGPANTLGHLLRAAAYYCLYKAVVEVGLARPYELLFRDLANSRRDLLALNRTLEGRVAERTQLAERRAEQVRRLALALGQTERRERRRLAAVLHDHLQQLLVAARMYLNVMGGKLSDPGMREQARRVDELLIESIASSRSLSMELSPPVLQEGLEAALQWLTEWMRDKHGFAVQYSNHARCGVLPEEVRNLAFEAVRELLFNVVKHAGVKQADVELDCQNGGLHLTVSDRGVGFDPARVVPGGAAGKGLGLSDLRQRLELVGGSLQMLSAPGEGTTITVRLNLGEGHAAVVAAATVA